MKAVALLAALLAAFLLAVFAGRGDAESLEQRTIGPRTFGTGQIAWRTLGPERWAYRYRLSRLELRDERGRVTRLGRRVRELADSRAVLRARVLSLSREVARLRVGRSEGVTRALSAATGTTVWDRLSSCEAGGNWATNTGNGFYGGLQHSLSTWHAYGGSGYPHHATREQQIAVAERVLAGQGWGAWPACSRELGLR